MVGHITPQQLSNWFIHGQRKDVLIFNSNKKRLNWIYFCPKISTRTLRDESRKLIQITPEKLILQIMHFRQIQIYS